MEEEVRTGETFTLQSQYRTQSSQQRLGEMEEPSSASKEEALKEIAQSFKQSKFEPGLLVRNAHFQTIFGSGALGTKFFGLPTRPFKVTQERIETDDKDFFDVEYTEGFDSPDSTKSVIILHGLESNIKGSLVTRFATAFISKGFTCCLVSFRNCNGEENRTVGAYHVGFTKDVNHLVRMLRERFPHKKLYLSGFSLGGNVSLKFLGELGADAQARGVYGAAVTCVPFDAAACQKKMDTNDFNRSVYAASFLETLKVKAEKEYVQYPGQFRIDDIRKATTIGEFDDAYIAPIYGFRDKHHYYEVCGAKAWLHKIRVPSIAVNARDDPIVDEPSLPTEEHVRDAPVRLIYHDHGGHCGFYTLQGSMQCGEGAGGGDIKVPAHGWLAEELARAIDHIHNSHTQL